MAACLIVLPVAAQPPSGHYDAGVARQPATEALAFLRIPFGAPPGKKAPPMRFGFGLFADCGRVSNMLSPPREAECDSLPVKSLELSSGPNDPTWILSFSGGGRHVPLARLMPFNGMSFEGMSFGGESEPSFLED